MRGWLGAYDSAGHFLQVHYHHEVVNPCHETIEYDDPDWKDKFMKGDAGRSCKGQAVFFENAYKVARHGMIVPSEPDKDTVFSWPHEFLRHHGKE